jgi:phage prohead protease, HK97 family
VLLQKKDLALTLCELKFAGDKGTSFKGYASTFNGVDDWGDTIVPGAYARTLKERPQVPMLWAHDRRQVPPGKWLSLTEDSKGLLVEGELTPGNAQSENLAASMRHGALNGMSIGYYVFPDGERMDEKDPSIRKLTAIDLREISIVPMPADDSARIDLSSVKASIEAIGSVSDLEEFLRDEGNFSRSSAKAVISRVKSVLLRDAGGESEQLKALKAELARRDDVIATLQANRLCAEFRLPT